MDAKDLRVAGVDYDARYIKAAERRVAKDAKLKGRVSVVCASVYDGQVLAALRPKGGFDAAYFSGSLTLMPDPVEACRPWPPSSGRAGASSASPSSSSSSTRPSPARWTRCSRRRFGRC